MSYDPTQKYIWSPEEKIEISGQELAIVVNAVRSILNLPEAPAIILADKANTALDSIMAKNVEEGKIKPAPSQLTINKDEEADD
jgi:ABC-type iron transport system FetAB ATPase subunit